MTKRNKAIPSMEGKERDVMSIFLEVTKKTRGLTSALDVSAGINGKWINPNDPKNIDAYKVADIFIIKTAMQEDDQVIVKDVLEMIHRIRKVIKKYGIVPYTSRKKKKNK